jgi:hypothetical protein
MKGAVTPLHRKALLNALKTAAALDPERLDELLDATQRSFLALGWDSGKDLWALGPLLEIAGRMARHEDRVHEKLPKLAQDLARRQIVAPDRFGLDVEREESLTLSLLAITARVDRLVERETFGMEPDAARDWILDVALQSASHIYAELEHQDAAASDRPDMGADGKQMILQAALRESMNIIEPCWWREARHLQQERQQGDLEQLRAWLAARPEDASLSRIVEGVGEGVDRLIGNLQEVRQRITTLRDRLSLGFAHTEQQQAGGRAPGPASAESAPESAGAQATATKAAPASAPVAAAAPAMEASILANKTPARRYFGKRR